MSVQPLRFYNLKVTYSRRALHTRLLVRVRYSYISEGKDYTGSGA